MTVANSGSNIVAKQIASPNIVDNVWRCGLFQRANGFGYESRDLPTSVRGLKVKPDIPNSVAFLNYLYLLFIHFKTFKSFFFYFCVFGLKLNTISVSVTILNKVKKKPYVFYSIRNISYFIS